MWAYVVVCVVVVAAVGGSAYIGTKSSNKRGASGGAASASKRKRRVRRRSNLWTSSAGAGAGDTGDSDAEDAFFDLGVADFKGRWTPPAPALGSHLDVSQTTDGKVTAPFRHLVQLDSAETNLSAPTLAL